MNGTEFKKMFVNGKTEKYLQTKHELGDFDEVRVILKAYGRMAMFTDQLVAEAMSKKMSITTHVPDTCPNFPAAYNSLKTMYFKSPAPYGDWIFDTNLDSTLFSTNYISVEVERNGVGAAAIYSRFMLDRIEEALMDYTESKKLFRDLMTSIMKNAIIYYHMNKDIKEATNGTI